MVSALPLEIQVIQAPLMPESRPVVVSSLASELLRCSHEYHDVAAMWVVIKFERKVAVFHQWLDFHLISSGRSRLLVIRYTEREV